MAESQLGYRESDTNYILAEDGTALQGYTRYGEWYGEPYGDWNVLFAAFCITYADAAPLPDTADLQEWLEAWEEENAVPADAPVTPGELLFLDSDGDLQPDRVAIAAGMTEASEETPALIQVIEGDVNGKADYRTYTQKF